MYRIWPCEDRFRPRATHGEDDVVRADIESLKCVREDRQIRLMVAMHKREPLHETRANIHASERGINE